MPFPDGSGHIGVAEGWTTSTLHQGVAMLSGPDGASITLGIPIHMIDPRSPQAQMVANSPAPMAFGIPLAYVADPVQVFVAVNRAVYTSGGHPDPQTHVETSNPIALPPPESAAEISGTETIGGVFTRFRASIFMFPPTPNGMWVVTLNVMSAPDASFSRHEPAMNAIANSYTVTQWAQAAAPVRPPAPAMNAPPAANLGQNMADFRARMNTTFQTAMTDDRNAQTAMDTSTKNFIGYIDS